MKKRFVLILLPLVLSIAACNKPVTPTSEESSVEPASSRESSGEEHLYQNKLEKPSNIVKNMQDLADLFDYHAFYHNQVFDVVLDANYQYKTRKKTIQSELNYVYWYSELVNGCIGFDGVDNKDGTWTITYTFYENAVDGHEQENSIKNDIFYSEDPVENGITTFASEDPNKPLLDVLTSQQMWYGLEHGYRLNFLEGNTCKKYYDASKTILNTIISADMSDYQKTSKIYDYIEHNATYSFYAANGIPDAHDEDVYPDEYAARCKAYYIEGFFDDHSVVCDGFSKTYTLLGQMAGLNIVRAIGTSDTSWTTKAIPGHAYCFVEIDGLYYLSCPTWGQNNGRGSVSTNKNYFLSPESYISPYESNQWPDLNYTTKINNTDYFKNNSIMVNGQKFDAYIESSEDFPIIESLLSGKQNTYMDVMFASRDLLNEFNSSQRYCNVGGTYRTFECILYV